ncbi:Protein CDV3 homolog [Caenorhabditis elegans]|uniref:Protein CDV3 homolog n=1 Tax=Caenorhabditis elegans TaxID=6239 RepID=Q20310_CAEEL|nr:Protein CDV3 homolog [Caenorhabditis elegans]CCD65315.1 Protein CDV3 homolog [Caenorhabditis elegans]|eukprot:NP_498338.1 Uncharacterized protein CELE_F42A10.5 [Caenorhabditis elegans]
MSDDLSAFFAKKKDKKKKSAVKIEEVGQALERRAKRQEEYEQESEDVSEKRVEEEKAVNPNEESEWIEYGESQGRLDGLKIKDMGLESEQDQVNNEEPEDREVHETKTWGQVSSEKKATEEPEQAVTISDKAMAAAYKPPAMRRPGAPYRPRAAAANLDMGSDAAFPSLADASKIEKNKKEESKSPGGWVKAGSGGAWPGSSGPSSSGSSRSYPTTAGSGRDSALAALKMMSAANPAPARNEPAPAPAAAAPASSGAAKAGSYVPPHLRKNQ